jgi:N-carbamoylputrescine amidase
VVLSELHVGPYFCQVEDPGLCSGAESIPGPATDLFAAAARENSVVVVGSFFERRTAGLYHNTAVVFEKDGSIAGTYRKMHIPDDPGYYEKFYFSPGDLGFRAIPTSVGRLGVLVCWDQWYPEAARLMALDGADVLIYPTAIGWEPTDDETEKNCQLEAWLTIQRAHAIANGLPVLSVNRVGFEPSPTGRGGIQFWGNSFAAGPQGEWLARADAGHDELLLVDLDRERSETVRRIWPFLRDRRIDAYGDLTRRFRDHP